MTTTLMRTMTVLKSISMWTMMTMAMTLATAFNVEEIEVTTSAEEGQNLGQTNAVLVKHREEIQIQMKHQKIKEMVIN